MLFVFWTQQTALSEGIDTILKSNGEMASVEDAPQQDELSSTLDANNFLSPVNLKVFANPVVFFCFKKYS